MLCHSNPDSACVSFLFLAAESLKEKFNIKQQRVKCGRKEIRDRGIWEAGKELEGEENEEEEEGS